MALIRPIVVGDVFYPEAYSRIVTIRCDKLDAYIFVCTYEDEAARQRDDTPIKSEEVCVRVALLAGELYSKAYDTLKTIHGFESATDHLTDDIPDPVDPPVIVVDPEMIEAMSAIATPPIAPYFIEPTAPPPVPPPDEPEVVLDPALN